jgi:hypothetical protein
MGSAHAFITPHPFQDIDEAQVDLPALHVDAHDLDLHLIS